MKMKLILASILLIGLLINLPGGTRSLHLSNEQEQDHPDETNQHHQQQPPSNIQQANNLNTHLLQQQQHEQNGQRAQHNQQQAGYVQQQDQNNQQQQRHHQQLNHEQHQEQQQQQQHQDADQVHHHDDSHLVAPHFAPEPTSTHSDAFASNPSNQESSNQQQQHQQQSGQAVQFHDVPVIEQHQIKRLASGSSNNPQQSSQQQQQQQVVKNHVQQSEQHHQPPTSDVHTTTPLDSRAQMSANNQQQPSQQQQQQQQSTLIQVMQPQQQQMNKAQQTNNQQPNQIQPQQQPTSLPPMQNFANPQIQTVPMPPYQQQSQQQVSTQGSQILSTNQQQQASIRRSQIQKTQSSSPTQANQQQQMANVQQAQQHQPTMVMNQQQQQQYQPALTNQQQQQRQQSIIQPQQSVSESIAMMQPPMVPSASPLSQMLQTQRQQEQQQQVMVSKYQPSMVSPLYLGHNPFIEILRPLSYADDNIVTLNLSHSHIYEIDSDAFVGQRFEHIDLSNNKLGLIHSRSFRIGPNHSRHNPFDPTLRHATSGQSGLSGSLTGGPLGGGNSSKFSAQQQHYASRRPPPAHPKSVTIDFSHNPAIVALSGAFDHIDVPNCVLNFTNSTVELKFGAFKKYFKEHPGHIIDIDTVDCCDQEWLLGYKHNFVARTHCAHDPNLYLLKVSQQTIIDSCIAYVTSARHNLIMPNSGIIHTAAANGPRHSVGSHQDNQQYLTYLILGGTAMILTSLSIYIIFYMFSLKAAFVYSMQTSTNQKT